MTLSLLFSTASSLESRLAWIEGYLDESIRWKLQEDSVRSPGFIHNGDDTAVDAYAFLPADTERSL